MTTGARAGSPGIAIAAGGILALIIAWPEEHESRRPHPDTRPRMPGIHRATKKVELAQIDRASRVESAREIARRKARGNQLLVPSTTWVNLGPTDAPQEVNFFDIQGVDSGRPNNIAVDPRDPNVVYMAVSGGGVWKSFDFTSADGPHWSPTMDTQPNLAVGALTIDQDNPDVVYVGTGDFVDTSGNTIVKSSNGGGTWDEPVVLEGTYPSGGVSADPFSIRQIGVHGQQVLVATDAGLFVSSNGGTSFSLVDLPDENGALLAESVWSVQRIGGDAWVASGVTACAQGELPPSVFSGLDPDPATCPAGNNVALWRSTDGVTWTFISSTPSRIGAGNTQIAAGKSDDPTKTVVYAIVGGILGDHTVGFWRSDDGGQTYVDATGTLANPTLAVQNGDNSCLDIDVGHAQSWYNQAIVVDPTNSNNVLVGGNLCGMRTRNGKTGSPTWELVSHWLPGPGFGETANGRLSYVHADWHTATSVIVNGKPLTFAGTDGGIFSSTNVFDAATTAEKVVWTHHNKGLVTHLMYSVASGDPASGDAFVAFSGLQDNGTRFRANPANPSAFNQPIGGDGIGAAVHHSTTGTTYWGSVEFGRSFCKPALVDCSLEVAQANDAASHWHSVASAIPGLGENPDEEEREGRGHEGDDAEKIIAQRMKERARVSGDDEEPFFIHYADVETDTTGQSVLTHTDRQVFVAVPGAGTFTWKPISQDLTPQANTTGAGFASVTASRGTPGLYGAAGVVSAQPFYVSTTGNTNSTWKVASPVRPTGTTARMLGASSIDFPPVLPPGSQPGDVYIGSFTNILNDGSVPPDDKGHVYRTTDGGTTWTSIVGADPARQLPNVPVFVVKYDPVTVTTIYAGTQVGVYVTYDDGAHWDRMGDNFPIVPVRDIYVAKNSDFIRVATYGRGMWEIYPSAAANQGVPGNGDYDRNLQIDWVDLNAMSARLGVTPANTTQPFYSWILDIVGTGAAPTQAIDDSDLSALLGKFGGHP